MLPEENEKTRQYLTVWQGQEKTLHKEEAYSWAFTGRANENTFKTVLGGITSQRKAGKDENRPQAEPHKW